MTPLPPDWPPSWITEAAQREEWGAGKVDAIGKRLAELPSDLTFSGDVVRTDHYYESINQRTVLETIEELLHRETGWATPKPTEEQKREAAQAKVKAMEKDMPQPDPRDN